MTTTYIVQNYLKQYLSGRESVINRINARPHFVPLKLSILELTLQGKLDGRQLPAFHKKVVTFLTNKYKNQIISKNGKLYDNDGTEITSTNIKENTPAIVYSGNEIVGILFSTDNSYSSVYSGLFRYLNKEYGSKFFDVGHLNLQDADRNNLAESPSQLQAYNVLNAALSKLEETPEIKKYLSQMEKIVVKFENRHQYKAIIEVELDKEFTDSLVSVNANIVIIQNAQENKLFGKAEAKLLRDIKAVLAKIKFSRNMEEEISFRFAEAAKGKKSVSTKKKVKLTEVSTTTKNTNISKAKNDIVVPAKKSSKKISVEEPSLSSLQALLDKHLQDVISANMGNGNDKKVLNYRTGRLAASARVERLTQSREGMITAFYTYMKYPYATFSEGGKQQYPRSRDPKLLISKSIREIAATKAITRLRAVLL